MDKEKGTHVKKQNGVDKKEQSEKTDNMILAVFKILLGFNYHKMGTKKKF